MLSFWWREINFVFVVKLGVSILLLAIASIVLHVGNSDIFEVSDITPFLKKIQISSSSLVNFQENAHEIPTPESGPTKYVENERKCDIFVGDWVPYEVEPLYNSSCSFIQYFQNCVFNGRPDKDYLYWRWKPHGCDLPRFDPVRFLDSMRNKTWAFVGDSLSRNQVQSLICILSTVGKVVQVNHDKRKRFQTWHFPSYNFTTSVIWSPFLAKASIPENLSSAVSPPPEIHLHLDILDHSWTNHYNNWDYVVFSSGIWFTRPTIYYENNTILGCYRCPKRNLTNLAFDFAYRKVLNLFLDYVASSGHEGTTFYRTASPDHFEGGKWSDGGTCMRKAPVKEGEFELSSEDKTILEVETVVFANAVDRTTKKGMDFRILDVKMMSLLRADGHPGPYKFYVPLEKIKNGKVPSDCVHWCLPGPIDTWNDFLMKIVVDG